MGRYDLAIVGDTDVPAGIGWCSVVRTRTLRQWASIAMGNETSATLFSR
jgi:hypothetical protein